MNELNAREWALVVWLTVALIWALYRNDIRPSILAVLKNFFDKRIIIPFGVMLLYFGIEIWLGSLLSLWEPALIKDTTIWVITSGMALFLSLDEATSEHKFFRKRVFAAFKIVVFIQVFINLFVLNFPAELILQPFLFLVAALTAFAAHSKDKEHVRVRRLLEGVLGFIGISVLLFGATQLYLNWDTINKITLLRQLLLPVWLSIGLLPFMYVFAMIASYQTAFIRLGFATKKRKSRFNAKLAIILGLNFRVRRVQIIGGIWLDKIASAKNFKAALKAVTDYKRLGNSTDQF